MLGHGTTAKMTSEIFGTSIRAILEIGRLQELDSSIPPYKERTLRQLKAAVFLALDLPHRQGLNGGATSQVEVMEDPETTEFRRFLAAQARGMGTGSPEISPTSALQQSARDPLSGPLIEVAAEPSKGTSGDTQCSVSTTYPVDYQHIRNCYLQCYTSPPPGNRPG